MPLRVRLTLITTVVLTVVLAIFGAGIYVLMDRTLRSRVDDTLARRAGAIVHAVRVSPDVAMVQGLGFVPPNIVIQVVGPSGEVVAKSEALGPQKLPVTSKVVALAHGGSGGFTQDVSVRGIKFRVRSETLTDQFGEPVGTVMIAASLQDVLDTLSRLRRLMLLAGLAGIALAAALGWRSARTALRPVDDIGAAALRIGETGDLSERVPSGRADELGKLGDAFNTMLDRLQSAQSALSRTVETQRRFVDDASHELRTPLTIMRGNLELVARDPKMAPEERIAALRDAIDESERMTRLVDDLLALARVDAGVTLQADRVALASVVQEVVSSARTANPDRTIVADVSDAGAAVRGSESLLRRLLENLTDNAVKYTAPGGTVTVRLVMEGTEAVLAVADDGIGMSEQEQAQAFDRFWRSDASRERPGSGLGLAIAKAVTEAHGGTISVASQPGAGTTFTVRIPAMAPEIPPAPPPPWSRTAAESRADG